MSEVHSPSLYTTSLGQSETGNTVLLLLAATILTALAGGMAWGIRGQYGHEMGAMMFGVLAGFTLVMLFMPHASAVQAARTVALFAVAIGFGGSMSYGETVGLTQDSGVHGNVSDPHWNDEAYRWGMLGLAVKGGLWIGFGGAFLGLGMGGQRYRPREMMWMGLAMMALFVLGRWALNSPFDPDVRKLPAIYFSDHWRWEPAENVKPRPEIWGGILFAFVGMMAYLTLVKRDRLARNLAFWGLIGGLGFPIGQSLQASHNWDSKAFSENSFWHYGVNSWNMMEVTFGTFAGFALGFGMWLNRKYISPSGTPDEVSLSPMWEGWLVGIYVYLLGLGWLYPDSVFILIYYHGLMMGIIPMAAIVGGRYWPFLHVFPMVAMPIVLMTFRARYAAGGFTSLSISLTVLVTLPLVLLTSLGLYFGKQSRRGIGARPFACIGLLITSTLYFWLNFTFFSFPWNWWVNWNGWIGQGHSGAIYIISWLILSVAALICWRKSQVADS